MAVQKGVQVGCVDSLWGDGNPTGRQGSGLTTPAVGRGNGERVGSGLHATIVPHLATRRCERRMPVSAYPPRRNRRCNPPVAPGLLCDYHPWIRQCHVPVWPKRISARSCHRPHILPIGHRHTRMSARPFIGYLSRRILSTVQRPVCGTSADRPRDARSPEEPGQAQFPYAPVRSVHRDRASNEDFARLTSLEGRRLDRRAESTTAPVSVQSQKLSPELRVKSDGRRVRDSASVSRFGLLTFRRAPARHPAELRRLARRCR